MRGTDFKTYLTHPGNHNYYEVMINRGKQNSFKHEIKPVVCSLNIFRTARRTMIRFLVELLERRTWFGQSKLYFVLSWFVMRCKLRSELAADAQQTA